MLLFLPDFASMLSVECCVLNTVYSDYNTHTCILGTFNTFIDCTKTIGTGININIGIHVNKYVSVSVVCARLETFFL